MPKYVFDKFTLTERCVAIVLFGFSVKHKFSFYKYNSNPFDNFPFRIFYMYTYKNNYYYIILIEFNRNFYKLHKTPSRIKFTSTSENDEYPKGRQRRPTDMVCQSKHFRGIVKCGFQFPIYFSLFFHRTFNCSLFWLIIFSTISRNSIFREHTHDCTHTNMVRD